MDENGQFQLNVCNDFAFDLIYLQIQSLFGRKYGHFKYVKDLRSTMKTSTLVY